MTDREPTLNQAIRELKQVLRDELRIDEMFDWILNVLTKIVEWTNRQLKRASDD